MSETHQQITQAVESYVKENEAFETKGIKAGENPVFTGRYADG